MTDGEFSFQWHVTDRCNMRCAHCYQNDFSSRAELDRTALGRVMDNLFQNSAISFSINVTGGEPLLFPHLEFVLERLEQEACVNGFSLITNATVLQAERLHFLAGLRKLEFFKVSLEGAGEEENDAIRGPGNFRRVLRGIEAIKTQTEKPVVLMFTLGGWNLEQVGPVCELGRRLEVQGVIFERFVPLGQGNQLKAKVLTPGQWRRALENILEAARVDVPAEDLAGHHAFWLDFSLGLKVAHCNLGGSMALMPEGTVYPCRRLPLDTGNLLRESFSTVRSRLNEFAPERLKTRLSGLYCSGCPLDECSGCRALAAAVGGDYLGDDPCCLLIDC